ncbi:hypothetical protein [Acinetobacter variabilis]|uniref:Uncharacterized protein n=1 Tax=Acinetobacter variabilis TaxID=70346 RepID=N8WR71_9GAMM|nr:hypothetical protein [Acinetobacter variabilis]ENU99408.1 hypothetical protein F969_01590 [Acinetobacter variabilis]
MAFRADEAIREGREHVEKYLLSHLKDLSPVDFEKSRLTLNDLIDQLGPVVETYPTWHPLVSDKRQNYDCINPNTDCGYRGLDHTILFANGFITCPYGNGQEILDSVNELRYNPAAEITAERLDVKLYSSQATPILVRCNWTKRLAADGTVPLSIAIPLILENELPMWRTAEVAETWDSMRSNFLGKPHGKRSSLFVNQETGQGIKRIWESLINTGMFGPLLIRQ